MGTYEDVAHRNVRLPSLIMSSRPDRVDNFLRQRIYAAPARSSTYSFARLNEVGTERLLKAAYEAVQIHDVATEFQVPKAKLLCEYRFIESTMELLQLAKRRMTGDHIFENDPVSLIWVDVSRMLLEILDIHTPGEGLHLRVNQLMTSCFHHNREFWCFVKEDIERYDGITRFVMMSALDFDEQGRALF
jgi:hypothetical protein